MKSLKKITRNRPTVQNRTLKIRLSAADEADAKRLANSAGLSVSEWLRRQIRETPPAPAFVERRRVLVPDPEVWTISLPE